MANEDIIYEKCTSCGALGTTPVVTGWGTIEDQTCTACNGALKVVLGTADGLTSILDKCDSILSKFADNIFPTYEIVEKTDVSEYNALSDANKENYKTVLSLGTVDLTDGTIVRATLWVLFDSESTTRANLITLIGE